MSNEEGQGIWWKLEVAQEQLKVKRNTLSAGSLDTKLQSAGTYWKPKKKPVNAETGAVVLDVQEDMVCSIFDLLEALLEEAEDAESKDEVVKQEVICSKEAIDNKVIIPIDRDVKEELWVCDMEQDKTSITFLEEVP
jgi:hypothetical protein